MSKTKTRKIRDAIRGAKINQHDESSAGAVEYTEREKKLEIDNKLVERIQIQKKLRMQQLECSMVLAEIEELDRVYKDYGKSRIPKWYGIPMPKKILLCEINNKMHNFKTIMGNRSYLMDVLTNVGFNKGQIEKVLQGKYISDKKKLERMEQAHEKKKG